MLTPAEERIAKSLYADWFKKNPGVKNPTDPNTREKFDYMKSLEWELFSLMQQARKFNTEANKYPYPFTKWEYWDERQGELF